MKKSITIVIAVYVILSMLFPQLGCNPNSESKMVPELLSLYSTPLPTFYVPKEVSESRDNFYRAFKLSIFDSLCLKIGGKKDSSILYIKNAIRLQNFLNSFLTDKRVTGMRIYLGSRFKLNDSANDSEDSLNPGRMILIFAPTVGTNNRDDSTRGNSTYYKYMHNSDNFKLIPKRRAQKLVANYQCDTLTKKRHCLYRTLTQEDRDFLKFETKHVWFSREKITGIRDEIKTQLKKPKVTGIKIRLVSYTDADSIDNPFVNIMQKQSHKKRLTLDFLFTKGKTDYYIPKAEYLARTVSTIFTKPGFINIITQQEYDDFLKNPSQKGLAKIIAKLSVDQRRLFAEEYAMDTGDPTPPPNNVIEALDIMP